jgi:hypothetical protein
VLAGMHGWRQTPSAHSCPEGQQVRLVPVPQTCALGQHVPLTQVAPVWQHSVPQGVVSDGQAAHMLLTQLPLQHCVSFLHAFPLRLHPGGSADALPMPSDPSVPPTTAAPINLRALPREMLPLASPLVSSRRRNSLSFVWPSAAPSQNDGARQPRRVTQRSLICRVTKAGATSENAQKAKFRQFSFHALG